MGTFFVLTYLGTQKENHSLCSLLTYKYVPTYFRAVNAVNRTLENVINCRLITFSNVLCVNFSTTSLD